MYGRYELYLGHKNHHVKGFSENEVVYYILMKMRLCVLSDYAKILLMQNCVFYRATSSSYRAYTKSTLRELNQYT